MIELEDINDAVFPNNVVHWVSLAMKRIDPDIQVFKRSLRNTDPRQSIGVFAQMWSPDEESVEMQGIGRPATQVPSLQQYTLGLQAFVKDAEEERGLAVHSILSYHVRSVLYTDADLQLILGQLSVSQNNGWSESIRRWGVRTARYFSGEIDSQHLYLSTLEFWIETETRRTN